MNIKCEAKSCIYNKYHSCIMNCIEVSYSHRCRNYKNGITGAMGE